MSNGAIYWIGVFVIGAICCVVNSIISHLLGLAMGGLADWTIYFLLLIPSMFIFAAWRQRVEQNR